MAYRRLALAAVALLLGACRDTVAPPIVTPVDDHCNDGASSAAPAPTLALQVIGAGLVCERYTGELAVDGEWAYTTTWANRDGVPGNALRIWRIVGAEPVAVDSIIIDGATTLGDVQISDDGALLVVATEHDPNGSLVIFDRAEPGAPRQLVRYQTANTRAGVHTVKLGRVGGRLYGFLSINPTISRPALLVIVDLHDPAAPREVFAQAMGDPFVHDVFVRDGWLFTALWNDGIAIWDIGAESGSPAQPRQVSQLRTVGGNAHNIWWFHDPATQSRQYLFVGEEGFGGQLGVSASGDVHVVDISDMSNPREVAFYGVPGAGTHNFSMDEASGILYAAFYNGGVRALDVRGDLGSCAAAARTADGRCDLRVLGREVGFALQSTPLAQGGPLRAVWGVAYRAGRVYATDILNGLFVIDVSALSR